MVGGSGGRCFCRRVLITSYTTASARQCKCGRFSLPPYSKQERPLFTAALEQTSNMPIARDVGLSSGRIRWRASGLPYPASGRWSGNPTPPSVSSLSPSQSAFQHMHQGTETRPLPAIKRDDDQLSSGIRLGGGFPGLSSGEPIGHCASPVALSRTPPPRPLCDVSGMPPPAV